MVDVPTPDDVVDEINKGNEPTSLGDTAAANRDPGMAEEIVPDRRESDSADR